MNQKEIIQSPLNYTGGKYKLLPQILPLFPQKINNFYDLFCGGASVGCNVDCDHVVFNDIDYHIIGLFNVFKKIDKRCIFDFIESIIKKYNLSQASEMGYDYYQCDSKNGLGTYNKEKYLNLRASFNEKKILIDYRYYLIFYVLIVYSFNNQIRYNRRGDFNLPVGKRDFNDRMRLKLDSFIDRIKKISCTFKHDDFRNLDIGLLDESDFVYCDPPYLITCASYNEQGKWSIEDEFALLNKLDELNEANVRFALSNVLTSNGKNNQILQKWLRNNPYYRCYHLNYNYSNSNYQKKDRKSLSDEVLITNY